MKAILGQYYYAPHRRHWGVWVWTSVTETGASGTFVKDFMSKEEASSDDTNLIKGVKGLAAFLGCGINTAQNIINAEILLKGKIQYRTGKGWRFRRDKLTELLEKEPEIFKKVGSK